MKKITFIFNEENIVFHDELGIKPCSGTLSSALKLIMAFREHYKVTVYHKGISQNISNVLYANLDQIDAISECDATAIFVGSAGELLCEHASKFKKSYYWLHNYERLSNKRHLVKKGYLAGVICVSKYQLFTMLKSGMFFNSTYIHNSFEFKNNIDLAFAGALKKEKGIDRLIYLWKSLVEDGHDINLHIFGSGAIYDSADFKPGMSGVIEESFEIQFLHLMLDKEGNIDSRIKFYGLKSKEEMLPIIKCCDYFVSGLNEVGASECFSIAFLEAQSVNTPVLTLIRGGQVESLFISGSKAFVSIKRLKVFLISEFKEKRKLGIQSNIAEWERYVNQYDKKEVFLKRLKSLYCGIYVTASKMLGRVLR